MSKIKIISLSVFIMCNLFFSCKGKENSKTTVTVDDNKLRIQIDVNKRPKEIHYDKVFDISDLTKTQKDSIINHVFDSLHLGKTKAE